jgi:hypothetical protein
MKGLKKERTFDQRETLALVLWFFIIALAGILLVCLMEDLCLLAVPVLFILLIIIALMWKNNRETLVLLKKEGRKK